MNSRVSQYLLIKGIKVIVALQCIDNGSRSPFAHVCLDIYEVFGVIFDFKRSENGHLHIQVPFGGRWLRDVRQCRGESLF